MITATLDKNTWVEVLGIDGANAIVIDEDGQDAEVCVDRLDNIEHQDLDLTPLEW